MAYPHLTLNLDQLRLIFDSIDLNKDEAVDKKEMADFVRKLMTVQKNLGFKKIEDVKNVVYGDGIKNDKYEIDARGESKFKKLMTMRK